MKCGHKIGCGQEAVRFWTRMSDISGRREWARRCPQHAPVFADVAKRIGVMMFGHATEWQEVTHDEAVVIEVHDR